MSAKAWMLGERGDAPFSGHLRVTLVGSRARLDVAGRLAVHRGPVGAFLPARRVEAALRALTPGASDRNTLLRDAWATVLSIPTPDLGPEQGGDLSLLLFVRDAGGASVAGVGLNGVWARFRGRWESLAERDHPLLGPTGRPRRIPGALSLEEAPEIVVASAVGGLAALPPVDQIPARAGVRR